MTDFCRCENCEDTGVWLMAAGYEWRCPHCDHLCDGYIAIPETDTIQCYHCRTEYPLMGEDHAHE